MNPIITIFALVKNKSHANTQNPNQAIYFYFLINIFLFNSLQYGTTTPRKMERLYCV